MTQIPTDHIYLGDPPWPGATIGFTIYFNAREHPGRYVVRQWATKPGDPQLYFRIPPTAVVDTLEEARQTPALAGRIRVVRDKSDNVAIVETYL